MTARKKKVTRRKPAAKSKKKWFRLGIGKTLVSEPLLQTVPLDLIKAEVSRHLKKKVPRGGSITETRYANVPFYIATHPTDEFHEEAYRMSKDPAFLPETHCDLGTFHDALSGAL